MDNEKPKRIELEGKIRNILEKLIAYKARLRQTVKDRGQQIDMITIGLCAVVVSIGRSSEEIISPMPT